MDEKDLNIIAALRENSRASIRKIAKEANLRPSTVHQRISRMVKEKLIEKFTIKVNSKEAGEDFAAFMLITTKKDLEEPFLSNPHIKEAFGITGEYDLLLKMRFKDISEFNEFIINLRRNKSITKTHTMISTINLKEEM